MEDTNLSNQEFDVKFEGVHAEIDRIIQEASDLGNSMLQRRSGYTWPQEFLEQLSKTRMKWKERRFQVAIMALMKSGKSTLINSWLGREYLPAGILAETARIVRVRHNPNFPDGILHIGEMNNVCCGSDSIQDYLRRLNREIRDNNTLPSDDEIILEAPLTALSTQTLGEYGFEILDTPGPNENGVDVLRSKIDRLLRDIDVIVYVLDVTKLKTDDEKHVLDSLAERKDLLKDISKRMFFVVNKIDMLNRHDRNQNLTPSEIRNYIVDLLKKQIDGISVFPEQIFLISAENALLSRMIQNGHASTEQRRDFTERVFGGLKDENDPPTEDEYLSAAPKWLKKSGLVDLESGVISFIYKHRFAILTHSVIEEIERILTQVFNNLEVSRGTLLSDRYKIEELQREIQEIQGELKSIEKDLDKFREDTIKNCRSKFSDFQKRVDDIIVSIFSKEETATQKNILPKHITDLLKITEFEVTSNDKDVIVNRIKLINTEIFNCMALEFDAFWNLLISDSKKSYDNLGFEITAKLNPLKGRIEKRINETLNIRLQPINFMIKSPSLDNFYRTIENDISSLVKDRKSFNLSWNTSSFDFKGLSVFGFRIIGPKTIFYPTISLTETKYYASSLVHQKRLREQLKEIISGSTAIAEDIIAAQFGNSIYEAKSSFEDYSNRYIKIMSKEIENVGNNIKVNQRISEIEHDAKIIKELIVNIKDCNASL